MVDGNDVDPFPVFLIQDLINSSTKDYTTQYIRWGDDYGKVVSQLILVQGSKTLGVFEEIFDISGKEEQFVDLTEDEEKAFMKMAVGE